MKGFALVRSMLLVLTCLVLMPLVVMAPAGCGSVNSVGDFVDQIGKGAIGRLVLRVSYDTVRTFLADPYNEVGIVISVEDREMIESEVYDKILDIFPVLGDDKVTDYIDLRKFIASVFLEYVWPFMDDLRIPGVDRFGNILWDDETAALMKNMEPSRLPPDPVDITGISDAKWAMMVDGSLN